MPHGEDLETISLYIKENKTQCLKRRKVTLEAPETSREKKTCLPSEENFICVAGNINVTHKGKKRK